MSPLTGLDQIAMKDRSDNDPVKVASFPGAAEMKRTFTRFAAGGYLLIACASPTLAHNGKPHTWHDLWRTWSFEPFVVIGLALSGWFFVRGLRQLASARRRSAADHIHDPRRQLPLFQSSGRPIHAESRLGRLLFR